jgi:hypothetical protein
MKYHCPQPRTRQQRERMLNPAVLAPIPDSNMEIFGRGGRNATPSEFWLWISQSSVDARSVVTLEPRSCGVLGVTKP